MSYLPCLEIEVPRHDESGSPDPDAAVIWLHGLGADGNDFGPVIPELRLPESMKVRFVFPHAPSIPVTINNGYVMPAWYDIMEMSLPRRVDEAGLLKSVEAVHALIEREVQRGIDSRRIVLAGFSQGGAVIYHAALNCERPLAGALGLSTYFPTADLVEPTEVNRDLPFRICHGSNDPVIDEEQGKQSRRKLLEMGYQAEYSSYPMEHSLCMEEIRDISDWLQRVLAR